MKGFLLSVMAVLLLLPSASVPAFAAEEQAVMIAFDQLEGLVTDSNPDMAALRQSYEAQRLSLKEMEGRHRDLMDSDKPLESVAAVAIPLQKEIHALEIVVAYEESDLARALRQQLYLAQSQYLMSYTYELDIKETELALAAANEELARLQARNVAGYAAYAEVEAAEQAVRNWEIALRSLRQRQASNLTALAGTIGVTAGFTLAGLPEFDLSGIPARDLDADLEAYRKGAPGVRRSVLALEEAERALKTTSTQGTRYAVQAAKDSLALAQALAEHEFPQAYDSLLQTYHDYTDSSELASVRKQCQSMQRQWELGLVSANQLALAEQTLAAAELAREKQGIEVFSALLAYELNLDYSGA